MATGDEDEDDSRLVGGGTPAVGKYCGFTGAELAFTVIITLMSIEVNFSIDIPASLQDSMTEIYRISEYQFSLFYTVYYFPSMLLNVLAGYLIDKVMGVQLCTIVYCAIAVIGISMSAAGGVFNAYWLMIVGRFFFGLGNEMVASVCVCYCTVTYFKMSSVNFMLSMTDNVSFVGTVAVFQLLPYLYQQFSASYTPESALNIVVVIGSCSYLPMLLLSVLMVNVKPQMSDTVDSPISSADDGDGQDLVCNIAPLNSVSLYDIVKFPPVYWLLCLEFACFLNAIYTFETFSQGLLTSDLFNLTKEEASNAVTVMNFFRIALSIPLSLTVDRVGRNIAFVTVSCILCTLACLLLLLRLNPYITMVVFGVSYSLTGSSIWPMFAYPTNENMRGSCYGIVSALNGLSQSLSPSIVGKLIDSFDQSAAIYFYLANSSVSLVCVLVTWLLDIRSDGVLRLSAKQRLARSSQQLRSESVEALIDEDWNIAASEGIATP